MESKGRAASPLLRRIAVALKTFGLFPPPSQVADNTVAELLDSLHRYIDNYGPLVVRVSKRSLHVDDMTFKDAPSASLAFQLYTRRIVGLTFLHGITARDISTFLILVRKDRAFLEAEGGVPHLLQAEGVVNLSVVEVLLAVTRSQPTEHFDVAHELAIGSGVSLQHRQRVMEILRAGPTAIVGLFQHLHSVITEAAAIDATAAGVASAHRLVESLDALIASDPGEDHATLHANLAAAVLLLGEPVRSTMEHALATQVGSNQTAREVLSRLVTQRLISLIPLSALQADVPVPGAAVAGALDDQQDLLAEPADGSSSAPGGTSAGADSGPHLEPGPSYLAEARALDDEDAVMRDVVAMLVDAFRNQDGSSELAGFSGPLAQALSWILDRKDYGLLRATLHSLQDATQTTSAHSAAVAELVGNLLQENALRAMLGGLWAPRTSQDVDDIRACLAFLATQSVPLLMQVLAEERQAGVRRKLCDLIVDIGPDEADAVGTFVHDARWYLVRNAANILGRLQDPRGIPYLTSLVTHPEYRVRREAIEALVRLGTAEAEAGIAAFLGDRDRRIRLKVVLCLDDAGLVPVLPDLLGMLEQPDPLGRDGPVKEAIVAAVARVAAPEAMPVLKRLAGRRVLAPWSRRLRRQARDALFRFGTRRPGSELGSPALNVETGSL